MENFDTQADINARYKILKFMIGVMILLFIANAVSSCTVSSKVVHEKPVGYQKFHKYTCPAFI